MNSGKKKKESLMRGLIKNIFYSGLTSVISKIGALIFTVIIARIFLPELFGVYSLALTIILSLLILSDLGIGSTITRYLAESIGKRKKVEARSRFWFLLKTKLSLSITISVLLFLFSGIIAGFFKKPELILPLKIGSIYLFLNAMYNLSTSIFLSLKKLKYSAIGETIFQISRIIFIVILIFFFKSIEGVFIVLSLSLILSLGFSTRILIKKFRSMIVGKKMPVERRRMLKFSGFLTLSSITLLLLANMDKLVLGYFLDLEFIGIYNAIFSVVMGVLGLLGITSVFLPFFTQLKGKILNKTFKKTFKYLSLVAFPAAIGLAFIMVPLLRILYGAEYVPLEYQFSILITSVFLSFLIFESILSSTYTVLLNAKERPKIPAFTNLFTFIMNLILNVILVSYLIKIEPSYGLIGASFSTLITRYGRMFSMMFLSAKKIKLKPEKSSIIKPFIASLTMLFYLFIFNHLVSLNIVTGIILILSAAAIYFVILFLIKGISFKEIKKILRR